MKTTSPGEKEAGRPGVWQRDFPMNWFQVALFVIAAFAVMLALGGVQVWLEDLWK